MRTIKSVFEINEDSNIAGVQFYAGRKKIRWDDLSRFEKVRTLNAWANMHGLFYQAVDKKEDEE